MTTAKGRHKKHMENVRAVMRRTSLERILDNISYFEIRDSAINEGVAIRGHEPDDPPLDQLDRDQLKHLYELRDTIRQEMVEAGQTP